LLVAKNNASSKSNLAERMREENKIVRFGNSTSYENRGREVNREESLVLS
jgi:hypothetical protein